jgi:mannose-6-phosphate isomerase
MNQIRHIDKPWGLEIWWAHTDAYAAKLLQVEQGHRLSLQYHQYKDESCYLLSGLVRLVKGPSVDELEETELGPGTCWRNHPGEIHTIEAIETSLVIEASTPHLDDVVRLLDDYGRIEADATNDIAPARPDAPAPPRLIDRDQLAAKLNLRRTELTKLLNTKGFPHPAGYFRGRILWEETTVDAWLHRPTEVPDVVPVAPSASSDAAA